jgi:hypothetical protein
MGRNEIQDGVRGRRSYNSRMRLRFLVLCWIGVVASGSLNSCRRSQPPLPTHAVVAEDWKIIPGKRVGSWRASGSESDLIGAYGSANVRDTSIVLGEGETAPGAMIYPDDPQRRIELIWSDPTHKRGTSRVVLRGERSRWMLPRDISLGTRLSDLEEKNGRPFRLAGFGWDYAGVIVSWDGGALDSILGPSVKLYLEPRVEERAGPEYSSVLGDRDFASNLPAMRTLNPRIYQIFVDFTSGP